MIRLNELVATRWLLMIWQPPERESGMLYSLGFRPTRKNALNWWRVFTETEREDAKKACRGIAAASLSSSWRKIPGVLDVTLSANCGRSPGTDEGRVKSEPLT